MIQSRRVAAPAVTSALISCLAVGGILATLFAAKIAIILPELIPDVILNATSVSPVSPPSEISPPIQKSLPIRASKPALPTAAKFTPPPPTFVVPAAKIIAADQQQLMSQAQDSLRLAQKLRDEEAARKEEERLAEIARQEELARQQAEQKAQEAERARLAKIQEKRRAAERAEAARLAQIREAELSRQRAQQKAAEDARNRERAAERQVALRAQQAELARQQQARQAEAERQRALAQQQAEASRRAQLAKQVSSTPVVTKRTPPSYPASARKAGAQGTTQITATITTSGRVSSPRVTTSSGNRSLDSAALRAVKKWRFAPAKNGLGQPISYQFTIPVSFRLQ